MRGRGAIMIYYDGAIHNSDSDVESSRALERRRQSDDLIFSASPASLPVKKSKQKPPALPAGDDDDFEAANFDADHFDDLPEDDTLEAVEETTEGEGSWWSDDPVRLYMEQIGQIPLLTRQEEFAIATEVET